MTAEGKLYIDGSETPIAEISEISLNGGPRRDEFLLSYPDGRYFRFTGWLVTNQELGSFAVADIEVLEVGSIYDPEGAD